MFLFDLAGRCHIHRTGKRTYVYKLENISGKMQKVQFSKILSTSIPAREIARKSGRKKEKEKFGGENGQKICEI